MVIFRSATFSKIVHNAVRAISSRRIISGSITGCDRKIQKTAFAISQIDGKLAQILKSEVKSNELFLVTWPAPEDYFSPFKIKDDGCEKSTTLTRDFDGEKIDVVVLMPSNIPEDYEGDSDYIIDEDDNIYDGKESQPLTLKVIISKENGKFVEFDVSASFHQVKINSILFKEPNFGPYAVEEEGDLQVSLREFLKIRGIKRSIYGFMYDRMVNKSREARVDALMKLSQFIND